MPGADQRETFADHVGADADREIVVGTVVVAPRGWRPKKSPTAEDFKAIREPGFAIAAMNFLIEDAGPHGHPDLVLR